MRNADNNELVLFCLPVVLKEVDENCFDAYHHYVTCCEFAIRSVMIS